MSPRRAIQGLRALMLACVVGLCLGMLGVAPQIARADEGAEDAAPALPYASVYEPDTSWNMAATVAWRADGSVVEVAAASERPATAFVWLDHDLRVLDRDGKLISDTLDAYTSATATSVIPAFYITDDATASALKAWLATSGLHDCFVVSTPDNATLVADVADLLHVRGMLDYTAVDAPSRDDLVAMVAATNAAHGKVILLGAEAATRENIQLLQHLASTVWVQSPTNTKDLVSLYTNGVNGVVVDDFAPALSALELFHDDAPSLLRIPLIIGHRGDPSTYVENTLESAQGALDEGVDAVENDIQLSSDGEIFVYHDETPHNLMGRGETGQFGDTRHIEEYTFDELKHHPFNWDLIKVNNVVPADRSRNGTLVGQDEERLYTVPSLREYLEIFRNTDLVHDTEIKSHNPDILPLYKELLDDCDAWDQVFTITFNQSILDAAYRDFPEMSLGALGTGEPWGDMLLPQDFGKLADELGVEGALERLYAAIDQWNATFNPTYAGYGEAVVRAGRHRGLTVWPWTYGADENFARDYMFGVSGMTVNYPWIASDYVVHIPSHDMIVSSLDEIPKPLATTRAGEQRTLDNAELVELEVIAAGRMLMIWRYKATLDVRGTSYGNYYLYSNPFVVTLLQSSHTHEWEEPTYTWSKDGSTVTASSICKVGGESLSETADTTRKVTKEPTCSERGEAIYTATFENPTFGTVTDTLENIGPLGHVWDVWTVTKPATESEPGEESHTCSRCGRTETRPSAFNKLPRQGDLFDQRTCLILAASGTALVLVGRLVSRLNRWRRRQRRRQRQRHRRR